MPAQTRAQLVNDGLSLVLPFLAAIAIVILGLKSLALVPGQLEAIADRLSSRRAFDARTVNLASIQEAEVVLGTDVWIPVYFPDYLIWPPSNVTIQRYPDKNVTLTFRFWDHREALVLKQYLATGINRSGIIPQPQAVIRRSVVSVADGDGVLVEGTDHEGTRRNVLYWRQQGRFIMMAGELPPDELVRMAHSLRSVGHPLPSGTK